MDDDVTCTHGRSVGSACPHCGGVVVVMDGGEMDGDEVVSERPLMGATITESPMDGDVKSVRDALASHDCGTDFELQAKVVDAVLALDRLAADNARLRELVAQITPWLDEVGLSDLPGLISWREAARRALGDDTEDPDGR
jgi:hypothetical protein